MILVGVRQENPFDPVSILDEVFEVWNDDVDPIMLFVGETQTNVYDNEVVTLLDDSTVFADLARST